MSDYLFPLALPGIEISLHRAPVYSTGVQTAASGKELRAQFWTYPRYKYHVSFEFVRTTTGRGVYNEMQSLLASLQMAQGQFDNLLLQDPEDNAVVGHGFGLGDGATTAFQLQRTMGGPRMTGAGFSRIANARVTNVALWNRDLTNGVWAATNVTPLKNQVGTDGFANQASSITATANNGTILQTVTLGSSQRTQSVSVKRLVGSGTLEMTTDGGATYTALYVTGAWTRVWLAPQTLANPVFGFRLGTSGDSFAVDLVQNQTGAEATLPIATTGAAVSADPTYYPAFGDGFEPITDAYGTVQLFKNGTLLVVTTDYTITPSGAVTMISAPALHDQLTWTGNYRRRVRLAADSLDFERFAVGYWLQNGLDLISVK